MISGLDNEKKRRIMIDIYIKKVTYYKEIYEKEQYILYADVSENSLEFN